MPKEYEINSMDGLQARVRLWTSKTFKKATARTAAAHLLSEAVELYMALGGTRIEVAAVVKAAMTKQPGEVRKETADVAILALDIAGRAGFNLYDAVMSKMDQNERREWGVANALGFFEHTPDAEDNEEAEETDANE